MSLYQDIFNRASIFDTLFFNVKAVLEYPTLKQLKDSDFSMYKHWIKIATNGFDANDENIEEIYLEKAVNIPEFVKIVSITYASIYIENGDIKRDFKKIDDVDEAIVIDSFFSFLQQLSSDGSQSSPQNYPILCSHNIISDIIPLLIKRYLKVLPRVKTKKIPYILKRTLELKPWESGVIDTNTVWKFNGYQFSTIEMISDFLELKNDVKVMSSSELSKYYHDNINNDIENTLKNITLQSAVHTNLYIQLLNRLSIL